VFSANLLAPYAEAVAAEIRAAEFSEPPDTLYLGGGTPSLLAPEQLKTLLAALPSRSWREATIEASPLTISPEKAAAWAALGINRVSLGVQSFVTREASATGRKHTAEDVAREVEILRQASIANINIDLIAGLPHQTAESWRESLGWVRRIDPPHVSVYMLEVDDDSRLGHELQSGGARFGAIDVPSDERITQFYELAVDGLRQMSIPRYEISNFAKPGWESVHNLKYWTMQPYLGFGADAHSFDGRRWRNVESPAEYVARFDARQTVHTGIEEYDPQRRAEERMFTGLRLSSGVQATPLELETYAGPIADFRARGWLDLDSTGRLRLTPTGILLSNEVFEAFVSDPVAT
jgi:oxygen-independent coproporphyrinogen-3 oxidase